jgi:hypothetical protein
VGSGLLESFVHSRKTAVRLVAGHIQKFAFLLAGGADFRWFDFDDGVPAVAAFPGIFGKSWFIFRHNLFPPVFFV